MTIKGMTMPAATAKRRQILKSLAATSLLGLAPAGAALARRQTMGPALVEAVDFSPNMMVERAALLAEMPFVPRRKPAPEITSQIDYDAHGAIRYDRDQALFADGPGNFPITFFALGAFFPRPVRTYAVDGAVTAEVVYDPSLFRVPADNIANQLPSDAGFAGFRIHEDRTSADWRKLDWAAFLGASYFRAIGALHQYGISARGVTVNTATGQPEEFPDFIEFHFDPRPDNPGWIRIHALLDGPSITGAYTFDLHRGEGVTMDVNARLFVRRDIERLGLAPLTSMYWYSERNPHGAQDWRPEVHDSDGLALHTGGGERIWRPLNNPERVVTSSFQDSDPTGFGLLQRDRDVEHYLDGVNYHLRPSLWVEPQGNWGDGAVELVEIPTNDEIHDNIVAQWTPARPARKGSEFNLQYRLHWQADQPNPPSAIGRVSATRSGRGGEPGTVRLDGVTRFVVDFEGGPIGPDLDPDAVDAEVSAGGGSVVSAKAEAVPGTDRWRLVTDIEPAGTAPVEIRGFLAKDGEPLTETWLFQHRPGRPGSSG